MKFCYFAYGNFAKHKSYLSVDFSKDNWYENPCDLSVRRCYLLDWLPSIILSCSVCSSSSTNYTQALETKLPLVAYWNQCSQHTANSNPSLFKLVLILTFEDVSWYTWLADGFLTGWWWICYYLFSMLGNNMDVRWTILSIETIGKFYSHPYLSVGLSSEIWDSPTSPWRIDLSRGLEPRYHIIPSCCGGVSHFAPWPSIWIELILTVTCMLIFIRRQTWL